MRIEGVYLFNKEKTRHLEKVIILKEIRSFNSDIISSKLIEIKNSWIELQKQYNSLINEGYKSNDFF